MYSLLVSFVTIVSFGRYSHTRKILPKEFYWEQNNMEPSPQFSLSP